jgi:hypothetical protein
MAKEPLRPLSPEQEEQVKERLRTAAANLPPNVDLTRFRQMLSAGMYQFAWEELRELAEQRTTPFPFWVEMSKAGELLGHR